MKIVFFGTPEFAVASLDALVSKGYEVAAVVTMPDRVGGRNNKVIESDVKKYAVSRGLSVLQPEKLRSTEFIETLKEINADLFIVIAFRMLPEMVWSMPRLGTFNLHASLLPQLRGAAPINHAIINGMDRTGVSTFFINAEIDKGNILFSESLAIEPDETAGSLHDKLMAIGSELVVKTVKAIEKGDIAPKPQPETDTLVPAPKIFKENCKIDFGKSAVEIDRLVRGLYPYPAAWCTITLDSGEEITAKILKVKLAEDSLALSAGACRYDKNSLKVATGSGTLEILELQPAGKKPMDFKAFLAGYHPVSFS